MLNVAALFTDQIAELAAKPAAGDLLCLDISWTAAGL